MAAPVVGGIAAATGLIGGVMQAVDATQQAKAAEKAAKYNAGVAERNAQFQREQTEMEAARAQREGDQVLGRQRALYGASGAEFKGSALDVLRSDAQQLAGDIFMLREMGERRAAAFDEEARMELERAKMVRRQGWRAAGSAILMGGLRAVSGGLGAYSMAGGDLDGLFGFGRSPSFDAARMSGIGAARRAGGGIY